jgi:RNA polymerase sigma-70 factor (ECF subfamily)
MHENDHSPIDADLVLLARGGDEQAAAQLYYRYADAVFRISYRVLLDAAAAGDCAQEVWCKVFRKLHTFDTANNFHGWLKAVTVRTAIDEYRRRGRTSAVVMEHSFFESCPWDGVSARRALTDERTQQQIESALASLSLAQRAAFVLRHYEGESIDAIAEHLNCNRGTVRTHLYRAIKALRTKLAALKEEIHHVE